MQFYSKSKTLSLGMADHEDRNDKNVEGRFFNDYSCIDCGLCPEIAPNVFKRDDDEGYSFVFKQPNTPNDIALAREAVESCPTESIGEMGA